MEQRQSYVGEINVEKVSIINAQNIKTDITNLFTTIVIKESLNRNTIRGRINIEDGIALSEIVPLVGNELIEIAFLNPAASSVFHLLFNIVDMSNRMPMKDNKQGMTYTLHFVSEESLKSASTRISKKYKGTISEIVENIYNEYLKTDRRIEHFITDEAKKINQSGFEEVDLNLLNVTNDAKTIQEIVVPNWTPLGTIEMLSGRGVAGQSNAVNFVFFETLQNFNFVSIDSLLSRLPKRFYSYGTKRMAGNTIELESTFIINFKINSSFQNPVVALANGMYSSTLITHDITRKKIEETVYNYRKDFENRAHLDKYPLIQNDGPKFHQATTSSLYLYPKHKGLHTGLDDSNYSQDWIKQGASHIEEISAISATVIIPGDSDISVGDIVSFDLHMFRGGYERVKNELIGGAYMIANLEHQFTKTEYQMKMDIIRDSFGQSIDVTDNAVEKEITSTSWT